ncbi:carbohydrate esterase [Cystobacter fuscus]|uniref:alpha/beta hydrolase-fold protein n=1 Tax=Cystobacter fuscus TaxID=43 RepID=UPI002B2F7DA8|nr:carbohydrate esterase [Cystobacter fuscus]
MRTSVLSLPRLTPLLLAALVALSGCPAPTEVYTEVEFDVTVPPETPVSAQVFLQGEHPAFRASARGLELFYQGGQLFSARAKLPEGKEVTFTAKLFLPEEQVPLERSGQPAGSWHYAARAAEEKAGFTVERWGPPEGLTGPQTVFLVSVPATTPPDDVLWLSGNQPELGNWNPAGVKLHKAMDNMYATSLSFQPGTSLEFKATRGSWATVEKDMLGQEIDNHVFKTGEDYEHVPFTVEWWADFGSVPPPQVRTGNIEYLHEVQPKDETLRARDVIVWLPPGYEEPENASRRYPVLYMHDGQNLMDATTAAYSREWNVDETAQRLVEAGEVEPLIIVGIYNAEEERIAEYTPVPFPPNYPNAGRADAYGRFLVEELKPLIDNTYRTRRDAASTGLAGSSLGGLVSLYLGLEYPNTFTRLGVISPSVWWADRDILQRVEQLGGPLPLRIWEDIGTDEGDGPEAETVTDAEDLYNALKAKGWSDANLKYTVVRGGRHNEKAWSERFGDILRFLFPPTP